MDPDNPLIPPAPGGLTPPPGLQGDDLLDWYFEAAADHLNLHAIVWPARNNLGDLVPPPPEHVLDFLARSYELVAEEAINSSSGAGTVAVVGDLPDCDNCGRLSARYDVLRPRGTSDPRAGYFCPDCYSAHGSDWLGATGDVYLMQLREVPQEVKAICDDICTSVGRGLMFDE